MDRGAWSAAVHGVTQSGTRLKQLSMSVCTGEGNGKPLQYYCLENPRMEEPGGLPSVGLHRVGHDWSDLAVAAAMIFIFWMLSFKPAVSLSSFSFIMKFFSFSLLPSIRVVSSVYLRLSIFLLAILIPTCASSNPGFCIMCSAYKLNMQGDNIQIWCTSESNLERFWALPCWHVKRVQLYGNLNILWHCLPLGRKCLKSNRCKWCFKFLFWRCEFEIF